VTRHDVGDDAQTSTEPSVKELVDAIKDDLTHLVKAQIALAKAEADADKKEATSVGIFGIGAAVLAFFSTFLLLMGFGFGLEAAGLWRWLAFLVAGVFLLVVAGVLGLLAKSRISRMHKLARTKAATQITKQALRPSPPE